MNAVSRIGTARVIACRFSVAQEYAEDFFTAAVRDVAFSIPFQTLVPSLGARLPGAVHAKAGRRQASHRRPHDLSEVAKDAGPRGRGRRQVDRRQRDRRPRRSVATESWAARPHVPIVRASKPDARRRCSGSCLKLFEPQRPGGEAVIMFVPAQIACTSDQKVMDSISVPHLVRCTLQLEDGRATFAVPDSAITVRAPASAPPSPSPTPSPTASRSPTPSPTPSLYCGNPLFTSKC
jgi:hypothetical protein